jgi:hypothetical protein
MAEWGVAMSHYHGLWDSGDTAAGRLAQKKAADLAATNSKTTARKGLHRRARRNLPRGRQRFLRALRCL